MQASFPQNFVPQADPKAVIRSGNARFTVLKSRLIRMEWDPAGKFEDHASQVFWYRRQPLPQFTVQERDGWLEIETEHLKLRFKQNGSFHWRELSILLKETDVLWSFGDRDQQNLGGTARTLDRANGAVSLEPGLVSRSGWALVDDSLSLTFDEHGWLQPRQRHAEAKDLYFFGYGHAYLAAIQEYQDLTGKPQRIPRWALGNWWSRYWAYSQDELIQLMLEFKAYDIPLSVCIVDVDWHITKTGNLSTGWTGYTWNPALFPDPKVFIDSLHHLGLKTALNLHPAEGIHPHEKAYADFCKALDLPANNTAVEFDIASPAFTKAYFEVLHHPLEAAGIDFWWMDWQQGTESKTAGLDPLFWLNHLHYYDLGRSPKKRPFLFSRWPGLGGHRYPIGFSGDTIVSWESLAFQPEFTSTASNVAFGWWSHDIGGHTEGIEEAELYLRWVQYGVFSPVFRLHSTNNPYIERRPWGYDLDTLAFARKAMQDRHSLVPVLYTAAYDNASSGEPPILPLYYLWPEEPASYLCPQEYLFCRQLLAAPFTQPRDPHTRLSRQVVWLPEGDWFEYPSGRFYQGGAWYAIYGGLDQIPVFARGGSIIPLAHKHAQFGTPNPEDLRLMVFASENGSFELYEDDGETQAYKNGEFAITGYSQNFDSDTLRFKIEPVQGSYPDMAPQRNYDLVIFGLSEPVEVLLDGDDQSETLAWQYDPLRHAVVISEFAWDVQQTCNIRIRGTKLLREETNVLERLGFIIAAARLPSRIKASLMQNLPNYMQNPGSLLDILHEFSESQILALYETIFFRQETPPALDVKTAYIQASNSFWNMMRS